MLRKTGKPNPQPTTYNLQPRTYNLELTTSKPQKK